MLSQVGSVTTNGIQQKSDLPRHRVHRLRATCRCGRTCSRRAPSPPGTFPLFTGIRVFDRDYRNPRIYAVNVGYERELAPDLAGYVDFTYAKGVHLTRFLNYNVHGTGVLRPGSRRRATPRPTPARNPFEPQLGDVFVTNSRGRSALPRPDARRAQALLAAAISSKPTTSCRRTKTTTRTNAIRSPIASFNFYDLSLDYGPSDRDIRHRFNFFTYAELPQARC